MALILKCHRAARGRFVARSTRYREGRRHARLGRVPRASTSAKAAQQQHASAYHRVTSRSPASAWSAAAPRARQCRRQATSMTRHHRGEGRMMRLRRPRPAAPPRQRGSCLYGAAPLSSRRHVAGDSDNDAARRCAHSQSRMMLARCRRCTLPGRPPRSDAGAVRRLMPRSRRSK